MSVSDPQPPADLSDVLRSPDTRGCLGSTAGLVLLALISPFAFVVHRWHQWRRGTEVRVSVTSRAWEVDDGRVLQRVDATIDVPLAVETGYRRRITDAVIRTAEVLRRPDDAYTVVYRMPTDEEAVVLPLGPQLQGLGERFFLTLNQGTLAGKTIVWLAFGRGTSPGVVVDPMTADPGADGEPEGLLGISRARWTMATEWARVGPSLIVRLILVVPPDRADAVRKLLAAVR